MFRVLFKKKKRPASGDDIYEILKLSTFGAAMSFATGFSSAKYSVSSSVGLESVFSIFLAREILISELQLYVKFVERQLSVDSLELTQDAFLEGYRMAISGVGFAAYARDVNVSRAGFDPGMVEPAIQHIADAVQQAFNEEHEVFMHHQDALKAVPLLSKNDIPARLVDTNGTPFVPLYAQVIEDLGKMQGRDDWGRLTPDIYVLAKQTVLECTLML